MKKLIASLSIICAAIVLMLSSTPVTGKMHGDVEFISGGVGMTERNQMKQKAGQYNLKLVFAKKNGDYLASVNVVIEDSAGKTILEEISDGPWFYVKLHEGKYKVTADYKNSRQSRMVQVDGGPERIIFTWE